MHSGLKAKAFASGVLLLCLVGMGALTPLIASSVGRYELAYADTASEGDPPEVAAGIAMGAFRGLFVNYLWIRANDLKEDGRFHESVELARAITKLQPRFPRVWAFHAWNLAYNISVGTQTPQERWQWVSAGVDLLKKEGIPANPNDMLLYKELSWIFLHKIGGYTDDANRYYKARLAADWTVLVGEPPIPTGSDRQRDRVIDLYVDWLRPIADAPDTIEALRRQNPAAARVEARLREAGYRLDRELVRWYEILTNLDRSLFADEIREGSGPRRRALAEIVDDPAAAEGLRAVVSHVRKRELIDAENMSPHHMIRIIRKFGPIDWRVPAAHGVYWAYLGVERGLSRLTDVNEDNFDFVNTDRMVIQSLQDLFRYGTVYFNFVDFMYGRGGYYQGTPNEYFAESYGGALEKEIEERGGVFQSEARTFRTYAAGYENFLTDVIIFFYRRGQTDKAERWYRELRTWEGQNIHAVDLLIDEVSLPLDEFVQKNLYDRYKSPHVMAQEVTGALQGSFDALLRGDLELHRSQFQYAAAAHAYFLNNQLRDVLAGRGGGMARMEVLDRSFPNVAGLTFAQTIVQVPPQQAVELYNNAGIDLQAYAYDAIRVLYQEAIESGELDLGDPFDVLFPQPPNLEEVRQRLADRERRRAADRLEGVDQQ